MRNPHIPDGDPFQRIEIDRSRQRVPEEGPGRPAKSVKLNESLDEASFVDGEEGGGLGVRIKNIFRRGGLVVVEQVTLHDVVDGAEAHSFGPAVMDKKKIGDNDTVTFYHALRNRKGVVIGAGVMLGIFAVAPGSIKK